MTKPSRKVEANGDKPKNPRYGGPPLKLTPERQERLLSALKLGTSRHGAACYAGIAPTTFYEWLKLGATQEDGPFRTFRMLVQEAESIAEMQAVAEIRKSDPRWFLSRRFAAWREKPAEATLTHQAPGGKPLEAIPNETLTALVQALATRKP